MVLGGSLGLNVTMALGGEKGHLDQYCSSGSMACEPDRGPKRWPSPPESAWHTKLTGAMEIIQPLATVGSETHTWPLIAT